MGFWSELVNGVRRELKPPASGFFTVSPNAPVQGVLTGNRLELRCTNSFTAQMLDKPDILEVVSRKASAMLGRPVRAFSVDMTAKPQGNPRMEQLMQFGMDGKQSLAKGEYTVFVGGGQPGFTAGVLSAKVDL
jgi:hypothetical protein